MSMFPHRIPADTRTAISCSDNEPNECMQRADQLNRECRCASLNRDAIRAELLKQPDGAELYRMIVEERPHLFTDFAVFVAETCIRRQYEIIAAVERVVALPAYRQRVLAYAPSTAQFVPKAKGVFLGYDFHLTDSGSQLIEINTNAGGGLLNAMLARAQMSCCDLEEGILPGALPGEGDRQDLEQAFWDMFLEEWRLEHGETPLRSIAIVDESPENQYLFPEFLLFRNLFARRGVEAIICDPAELVCRDGGLWHGDRRIDLVYNRLTDFGLEAGPHRDLRRAYLEGSVVVTPNPHAHALYADKRNLVLLTNDCALRELNVEPETRELLLTGIARTIHVRPEEAETLWAGRKRLFFKPAAGYGSKAAYRGDKMTRRVFEEILRGEYVAQTLVPPSERLLKLGQAFVDLKLDLRNYVYGGVVQSMAARLYQGQTTNFRTPGGGFAQVVIIPCIDKSE